MSSASLASFTKTESMKPPFKRPRPLPPLTDEPITIKNWIKHVEWTRTTIIISSPLIAIYGIWIKAVQLQQKTFILACIYYLLTMISFTAGYHRLWSHRAYRATLPLQWFFAILATGAMQGSILWWSHHHRAHHRWTDTDKDPYGIQRGLFFAHIGWTFIKRPDRCLGTADLDDLKADRLVQSQDRWFPHLAVFMSYVLPALIAGIGWGDYKGGFFYAGALRLFIQSQAIFCLNSLAHYFGEATFDDHHSPRNHWITAVVTLGEGYHNFHHQFPQDFRNAIEYYQFDPTKWAILFFSWLGLAYDLKRFPENEIKKGALYMQEKSIASQKAMLNYGTPLNELPVYDWDEFQRLVSDAGKQWVLIEGVLYDVEEFIDKHPGGKKYLSAAIGRDMTAAFNGGVYDHSNGARNLMTSFRIGVLCNGMQVMADDRDETLHSK